MKSITAFGILSLVLIFTGCSRTVPGINNSDPAECSNILFQTDDYLESAENFIIEEMLINLLAHLTSLLNSIPSSCSLA